MMYIESLGVLSRVYSDAFNEVSWCISGSKKYFISNGPRQDTARKQIWFSVKWNVHSSNPLQCCQIKWLLAD